MKVTYQEIKESIAKKNYAPVYFLDGEEPYFLDKLMDVFEDQILTPAEKEFNLTVLYGRDTEWKEVVNACRRFPMFAEKQIVLLKDAAAIDALDKLGEYFLQPSPTTILVVEHRNKKVNGKTKVSKIIEKNTTYYTSEKLKESAIPSWIKALGVEMGLSIAEKEAEMITMSLGDNLQKISNEIEKIRINIPDEKSLTAAHIQKYIGISRDYNLFDFADAFFAGNKEKTYPMMTYFIANTKTNPMVLFTAGFYYKLQQIYRAHFASKLPEKDWGVAIGCSPYAAKTLMNYTRKWSLPKIEEAILLLAYFNAKGVGIDSNDDDSELLKEFFGKMELIEFMA